VTTSETPRLAEPGGISGCAAKPPETSVPSWGDISAQQLRARREAARRSGDGTDPWHGEVILPLPRNLEASRKAWMHLNDLGLIDDEGWLTSLIKDAGGVTWQ
jgi:hypothetical protein